MERIARVGAERWAHRAEGLPFAPASDEDRPIDVADAYLLQRAYIKASGGTVAGYKVAATNPTTRALTGLHHPCYGMLLSRDVHAAPTCLPFGVRQNPKIEAEIAFRIARDIPIGLEMDQADLLDYIEAVIPAIELADDRWAPRPLNPLELIAENAFQSAVVLGTEISDWKSIDLGEIEASIKIDGRPAGDGIASDISGHPLNSVLWLHATLARSGEQLRGGMIVMSGCMIMPPPIAPGETATVDYGPYGSVVLKLGEK